jgi:hypothetical protein
MTKRFHEHCPDILKPHTKYSSRRELSFDVLDSSYVVATAGGEAVGRGETLSCVHASELAFWPKSTAEETWNGLIQAVPNTDDTAVFVESTANGVNGVFFNLWKGAVEGTNGFLPVFIPWFTDPEYREKVTEKFERTPDEQELVDKHSLDDEQLMFRRRKIAQNGIDLFRQEYPSYPDEAFLTTGRPVFNPDQLIELLDQTNDVQERLALEDGEWVNHSRGELTTYIKHDEGERYVIGADVAMGVRNGDWSVATVLDSKKKMVAIWRGQVHPDYFADILYALGTYYNEALVIVENNGHGILTCTRLGKDYNYPNFYTEVQHDKLTDRETVKLGFSTTAKTKPLIIDQLRASMRLANYIHEGAWEPVETPDELYIEMV